jgi:peptidoglycan/LPS O-acetylase OafA/YrhL
MAGRTLIARMAQPAPAVSSETGPLAASKPSRVPELDGIRALAIWLVLVFHAIATPAAMRVGATLTGWHAALWQAINHGWLGVDLFFVLSGFLITGILLDAKPRSDYYQGFYARRARRILPVLLVVLGVFALIYRGPAAYFGLALIFCANLTALLGVATPLGLGPLWSLAVEEQFYLFWPWLARALPVRGLAILAGLIVLCEPLVRFAFGAPEQIYYTWFRCDGLALGALLAIWVRSRGCNPQRSLRLALYAGVAAALLGCVELIVRSAAFSAAVRTSEAGLLFASLLLAAYTLRGSRWTAILRSPAAGYFAATSYCVYVIHAPLFGAVDALGLTRADNPWISAAWRAAFGLPLVFGVATLSRKYLEDPFLRLRGSLRRA